MVLVRRTELACRNGWDHDLWEPREPSQTDGKGDASAPAATNSNPPNGDDSARTDTLETISIAPLRPVSRATAPASGRAADHALPSASREADGARTSHLREEVTPERGLHTPNGESASGERRGMGSEPPEPRSVAPAARETSIPRSNRVGTAPRRTTPVRFSGAAQWATPEEMDPIPESPLVRRPVTPRPGTGRAASPPAGPTPTRSRPLAPRRVADPEPVTPSRFGATWVQSRSGSTEPFTVVPEAEPPVPDIAESQEPRATAAPEVEAPPAEDEQPASEPSALTGTSAATLPRCCRTCRDFRPAETGDRGWCNNRYAFEHPQMVQADDLACESTIGTWWVPADDWWLQRADIAHHARPTPIVDEYLHQLLQQRAEARRREAR